MRKFTSNIPRLSCWSLVFVEFHTFTLFEFIHTRSRWSWDLHNLMPSTNSPIVDDNFPPLIWWFITTKDTDRWQRISSALFRLMINTFNLFFAHRLITFISSDRQTERPTDEQTLRGISSYHSFWTCRFYLSFFFNTLCKTSSSSSNHPISHSGPSWCVVVTHRKNTLSSCRWIAVVMRHSFHQTLTRSCIRYAKRGDPFLDTSNSLLSQRRYRHNSSSKQKGI